MRFSHSFLLAAAIILAITGANAKEATASGFAVSPSSIDFALEKGLQAQRQLIIYNTGEEPAEFSAASSNPQAITLLPNAGTIKERGHAVITATAKGTKTGISKGEIVIGLSGLGSNSGKEVSLSLGTAVPVKITVVKSTVLAANAFFGIMLSAGIVVIGTAAYYTLRKKTRRLSAEFCSAYDLYMRKSG